MARVVYYPLTNLQSSYLHTLDYLLHHHKLFILHIICCDDSEWLVVHIIISQIPCTDGQYTIPFDMRISTL
jgi:hypothetical protein